MKQGSVISKLLTFLILFILLGSVGVAYHLSTLSPYREVTMEPKPVGKAAHEAWARLRDVMRIPEWQPGVRAVMPTKKHHEEIIGWRQIYARNEYASQITQMDAPDSIAFEGVSENKSDRLRCVWTVESLSSYSSQVGIRCHKTVGPMLQRYALHHSHDLEKQSEELLQAFVDWKK